MPQMIPLNDLGRAYRRHAQEIDSAVARVLRSGWYVMGPEHDAFEADFAAYCNQTYCIAVANGTDALEIALRAAGCASGDKVAMAANAGGYAAAACMAIGAVPVFVDVDDRTLLMAPESLRAAKETGLWGVIVTHLYGTLAEVTALRAAIGETAVIVEDCAQAHGAHREGRVAGAFGDVATFSFYPTKNLGALGDGGAIVTSRAEIADRARRLRQYGWRERFVSEIAGGRNSRLDEIQAAVLRVRLKQIDANNERRRTILAHYKAMAPDINWIQPTTPDSVVHLCVLRHGNRDRARALLAEAGVATGIHYPLLDTQQPALVGGDWEALPIPVSELATAEILTVPCFPEMTDIEIDNVARSFAELA